MVRAPQHLSHTDPHRPSPDEAPPRPSRPACPCCGAAAAGAPAPPGPSWPGRAAWRCLRCGARLLDGPAVEQLTDCAGCGLPLAPSAGPGPEDAAGGSRCEVCRDDPRLETLADPSIARAGRREALAGLARALRFSVAPGLSDYLAAVACRLCGTGPAPQVHVVDDERVLLLALPPDVVLVSAGTLRSARDEAELAFLVAHELAHLADPTTSLRLVRAGLGLAPHAGDPWLAAALELLRLGHGDERELAADRSALAAVIAAGYEPRSALRWLARLDGRAAAGEAPVAEMVLAHPPPATRAQALEVSPRLRLAGSRGRTNREPFRRVAGHAALSALQPAPPPRPGGDPAAGSRRGSRALLLALAALVALAATVGGIWWLLARAGLAGWPG